MAFLSQFTPSTLTGRPATMPGDASGTSMVMRRMERVPAHVEWPFNWASEVASQASRGISAWAVQTAERNKAVP